MELLKDSFYRPETLLSIPLKNMFHAWVNCKISLKAHDRFHASIIFVSHAINYVSGVLCGK